MISGDAKKRSFNEDAERGTPEELAQRAVQWSCLRYGSGNDGYDGVGDFPTTNCESGYQSRLHFPSCWDGEVRSVFCCAPKSTARIRCFKLALMKWFVDACVIRTSIAMTTSRIWPSSAIWTMVRRPSLTRNARADGTQRQVPGYSPRCLGPSLLRGIQDCLSFVSGLISPISQVTWDIDTFVDRWSEGDGWPFVLVSESLIGHF